MLSNDETPPEHLLAYPQMPPRQMPPSALYVEEIAFMPVEWDWHAFLHPTPAAEVEPAQQLAEQPLENLDTQLNKAPQNSNDC